MKSLTLLGIFSFFCFASLVVNAADRLKDFRGTEQKLAVLGFKTETVEPDIEKKFLDIFRKEFNKYSRSYGGSSIEGFNLGDSSKGKFYAPISGDISEEQKKFLVKTGKDNSIDIIVLGQLSQQGLGLEMELQLFDIRIETLSKSEKSTFTIAAEKPAIESLVFKVMNYLDREGFVHQSSQDFLQPPISTSAAASISTRSTVDNEFAVNPTDLAGGELVGRATVGGEKRPFWEAWWFWTLIGGGLLSAGGLSYYFLVVNQPPSGAKVQFTLP